MPERLRYRVFDAPRARAGAHHARAIRLAAGVATLASLVLAGCGGGPSTTAGRGEQAGSSTSASGVSRATRGELDRLRKQLKPSARDKLIRAEVRLVLASINPLACSPAFVTERFLEASYGGHQGCVKSRTPGSVADHVDFKSLQVEGDRATAVVVPAGGPNDGERITVSLLHDSRWAVNRLHSNIPVGP